jgi:hypothetical protein
MTRRAVEHLLDALSGGFPWCFDAGLSALFDQALLLEEGAR